MKRIISYTLIIMMFLCLSASFSYGKEYVHTSGENTDGALYATREQAVARFVDAVGTENYDIDIRVLDKFSDREKISYINIGKVAAAVGAGLVSGYDDNTLRPQNSITRIEALTILSRALSNVELVKWYDTKFSDTPAWAEKQVDRLAAAGIVRGFGDGKLGADNLLTLEQIQILCDRVVRYMGPAGDYYEYINSIWLKNTTLEDGASVRSDIDSLNQNVNSRIAEIIFSLYKRYYNKGEDFADNSDERKIISVYSAAANQGYRDKIGLEAVKPLLEKIDSADNSSLPDIMAELEKNGFSTLINVAVDVDIEGTGKYLPVVAGCYTGPGSEILRGKDENILAYRNYIERLFEISGEDNPKLCAERAVNLCKDIAEATKTAEKSTDLYRSAGTYNVAEIRKIFSNIDIVEYFKKIGFEKANRFIVYDSEMANFINGIIKERSLDEIKAYLKAAVLDMSALYTSTDMFDAYQTYQNELNGTKINAIPSDYAFGAVQELLGWELGKMYKEEYFSENAKKLVEEMTAQIIAEYEKIINGATGLSPQTRRNVISKLKKIKVYVAYPDNIDDYCKKSITLRPTEDGGSLMEYRMEYAKAYVEECKKLLNNKADSSKKVWKIYPQTVNAMYDILSNSITVPAGILQAPYFEASASIEENLGGIGAVIAHEISHAFDSAGAKFDENGKRADLWSDVEKQAFSEFCEKVKREYNDTKINNSNIDGEKTLNENIADIAAMTCIIELVGDDDVKLDRMFKNYAKTWRIKATDEYIKRMLKSDVHAPNKIRVNRVLSNFDEFKRLYGVVEGDGMYIPEERIIKIWR